MNFFFLITFFCLIISSSNASDFSNVYAIDAKNLKAIKLKDSLKGNLNSGKNVFISRKVNCLSCHQAPINNEKFQGNFGPPLLNVGSTYSKEELRLRIINSKIVNPKTIMPSYFVKITNPRTPKKYFNKTILSAQEVEDLVEYLYSLK
tara:strand:- start:211 stop:654 length:444 start_codon:yes stop_codon:yes gene_type:complete